MNTTTMPHSATYSLQHYKNKERIAFASIPGMTELCQAQSEAQLQEFRLIYPDAAFALMIASNLFCPNKELTAIYLQAYQSILDGGKIDAIRFRFDKELNAYWKQHMWDD